MREECRRCVVYRVRAAWCFQVLGLGSDVGHAKQFCNASCQDCAYYRRVRGLATNVLVITSDEGHRSRLVASRTGNLVLRFAQSAYEASAVIHSFRPAFALVDRELAGGGEAGLLECLASDPRAPGLKIILAVPPGLGGRKPEGLGSGVVTVIEKPFGTDQVAAAIHSLPVEMLPLSHGGE